MEEKIYQKLLAELGKTSLSEITLRKKSAQLAKKINNDEDLPPEVISDAIEDLKVSEGQISHEVRIKVDEALKNRIPQPTPPGQIPDVPQDLMMLKEKITALENFKADYEKSQSVLSQQSMREKLAESIKKTLIDKNGCEDNVYLELAMSKINFDNDETTNIASLKKFYDDKISLDVQRGGYIPSISIDIPSAPKTAEQIKKEDEELIKKLMAEGKL